MAFTIQFTPNAREHLKHLRKAEQQTIMNAVSVQLAHQPDRPTKHRKRLDDNPLAPWELRVGKFRVFYDIIEDEECVIIVAVGRKEHNRLFIGGEEIEL